MRIQAHGTATSGQEEDLKLWICFAIPVTYSANPGMHVFAYASQIRETLRAALGGHGLMSVVVVRTLPVRHNILQDLVSVVVFNGQRCRYLSTIKRWTHT